jgi:hypothetical protein
VVRSGTHQPREVLPSAGTVEVVVSAPGQRLLARRRRHSPASHGRSPSKMPLPEGGEGLRSVTSRRSMTTRSVRKGRRFPAAVPDDHVHLTLIE